MASPATALLQIDAPPTFAKVFVPEIIGEGFDTTLTFTIDNTPNGIAATGLAFVDVLPFDLLVASRTCGGQRPAEAPSSPCAAPFDTTSRASAAGW